MQKIVIALSFIWFSLGNASQPHYTTTQFFQLFKDQKPTAQSPICIFVASSVSPLKMADVKMYQAFFQHMIVPASFFKLNYPQEAVKPFVLVFDWVDQNEGSTHLRNETEHFIQSLAKLKKEFPKNPFLIMCQGRGSILVNAATHAANFSTVIDAIVQIGTPVYQGMYPNEAKCNLFFNIYNQLPYNFKYPLNHKQLTVGAIYNPTKKFKPYNILLLVNNEHISFQKLFTQPIKKNCPFVGAQLLYVCKEATTLFSQYRHVWASLSDLKPESNLLMGLLEKLSYTKPPTKKEYALNGQNVDLYCKIWNLPLNKFLNIPTMQRSLHISEGTRLRSKYSAHVRPLQKFAYQTA